MRILLFANSDWYLYNFRLPLARTLRDCGVTVLLASPPGSYSARLQDDGFRWISVPMDRGTTNPLLQFKLVCDVARLYAREKPDIVHHFTMNCVIAGSFAAQLVGVRRRVNAITGMGYIFTSRSWLARLLRNPIRWMLRLALGGELSRVIVQNIDDARLLESSKAVQKIGVRLIRGSGVNTARFSPADSARKVARQFRVLLAARIIREKGIEEFVEAAKQLKSAGSDIEFLLAGSVDNGRPAAIAADVVESWSRSGFVSVLGHVEDMLQLLQRVDLLVLPSYYGEGVPRSLIEAAACGLPVVTTNAPGCREVVEDRVTGLVVPCRDSRSLASAIEYLRSRPEECRRMGAAGREKALREFDERIILEQTLDVYRELLPGFTMKPSAIN